MIPNIPTDRPLTAEDVALLREGDVFHFQYHPEIKRTLVRTSGEWPDLWLHFAEQPDGASLCDVWLFDHRPPSVSADPVGGVTSGAVAKPLDWRKPTKRDRDEGGRDSALWIAPGFGGEYAIQADLQNFILWRIDDPYAFDTFPTVEAAKAHAEADWQKTIGRKLAALSPKEEGASK